MTDSPLLRHDETLFRVPVVFEFTYLPDHLHHRDARNPSGPPGTENRAPHLFNILIDHSLLSLLRELETVVGVRVLAWVLTHPTCEIHIN